MNLSVVIMQMVLIPDTDLENEFINYFQFTNQQLETDFLPQYLSITGTESCTGAKFNVAKDI
jgi:hypothetical protein